jgi:hypothetical protein
MIVSPLYIIFDVYEVLNCKLIRNLRKFMKLRILIILLIACQACADNRHINSPGSLSGIYPHLAMYNNEDECGTGAVVPWADRLWVITYGPHLPFGSSDKLYELNSELKQMVRSESIGGTPANRMIHGPSSQLFIGPYAIDKERNVRAIPYEKMPGRHTGNAAHLTDPDRFVYYGTMEEGFYELDVESLEVKTLFPDGNTLRKAGEMSQYAELLAGAHGKGLYSGQGVLVYSNNGEANQLALERFDIKAGALAEWDGKEWKIIRRNQFTEVSGPGGIYGNRNPVSDPVWATGWDHKSLLLGVREAGKGWSFFRLPKASHSYDGAHGWNTEWPRIRDVGTEKQADYLMTMHGMFWNFPSSFSNDNTGGLRPRSAYLKVIGDFARWNDQLVFGCDDAAKREFLNSRKVKGSIRGPGQSNSNLWFTSTDLPDMLGPSNAEGAVWLKDTITAGVASDPFLFTGWDYRSCWVKNDGPGKTIFKFEADKTGNNTWEPLRSISINPGASAFVSFSEKESGEWVRIVTDNDAVATAHFTYAERETRNNIPDEIFKGLAKVTDEESTAGLLWCTDNERKSLALVSGLASGSNFTESGYYELDERLVLSKKNDTATSSLMLNGLAIPENVVEIDEASVLITDDKGRRWRLPKGREEYVNLTKNRLLRICREVATERDLFSCAGTFYELPAENADGFAKIRPVASHNFRIFDYASYRGMLVMTGINPSASEGNEHIIISDDEKAAVWAGVIDDLWKLGKPSGEGGPWKNSKVKKDLASDPYLIGFYDKRSIELTHDSDGPVSFTIEADPSGQGPWMEYMKFEVKNGKTFRYTFPREFQARWIRIVPGKDCTASAWLKYE